MIFPKESEFKKKIMTLTKELGNRIKINQSKTKVPTFETTLCITIDCTRIQTLNTYRQSQCRFSYSSSQLLCDLQIFFIRYHLIYFLPQ